MASTAQVLDHVIGYQAYRNVPDEVTAVFKATLPVASLVKKATIRWPADDVIVFLRPSDGHLHVMPIGDDSKYHSRWEKFASFDLISGVRIDREHPDPHEYVMIKRAVKVGDVGRFVKNIYLKPQEWVLGKGKANPLSMMLAGSAITGLAGWGLGTAWDKTFGPVAHKLAPKYFSGRPQAGKWMGILGAMLGGGVPLWLGTKRHAQYGWPGWTMPYSKHDPSRLLPEAAQTIRDVQQKVHEIAPSVDPYREERKESRASVLDSVNEPQSEKMYKRAAEYYSQMYMPIINVEEFTARIWDGVEKRAYYIDPANDPYRNRLGPGGMALNEPGIHLNTFGSPMNYSMANPGTPPASAALAAGLVHGASAARGGSNWVSPMDVGRIAIGAGSGLLSGIVAGKILGALAGLTPAAENNIKRIGIWAGGLNAARNLLI
jgi:hypothetical protein